MRHFMVAKRTRRKQAVLNPPAGKGGRGRTDAGAASWIAVLGCLSGKPRGCLGGGQPPVEKASKGLVYTSESDAPLEPFACEGGGKLTAARVREPAGADDWPPANITLTAVHYPRMLSGCCPRTCYQERSTMLLRRPAK